CPMRRLKRVHRSSRYSTGSSLGKKLRTSFRGAFLAPSHDTAATYTGRSCSPFSLHHWPVHLRTAPHHSANTAINRARPGPTGSAKLVLFLTAPDIICRNDLP